VVDEGRKYFDHSYHINLKKLDIKVTQKGIHLTYHNKSLPPLDCIYIRGSYRYRMFLKAIAEYYKDKAYMPINSDAFDLVHNKLYTHLVLSQHNIPMPQTYIAPSVKKSKKILKKVKYPIIIKVPNGTQGKGVMFADSFASASSTVDALDFSEPFLIQEYIETDGRDSRLIVTGNKVVAGMHRHAAKGEKRSNIHAGGTGQAYIASRKVKKIAVNVARVLKSEIVGVDILKTHRGAKVIEANISPGLQGITKATDKNVAGDIAKYLAEKTEKYLEMKQQKEINEVEELINSSDDDFGSGVVINPDLRGNKILLPEFVTNISGFRSYKEVTIKVKEGKVILEKTD
ncbi:MAG: ATP-grasp domain-containing protein, partial [Halanaerobiales bacterium]